MGIIGQQNHAEKINTSVKQQKEEIIWRTEQRNQSKFLMQIKLEKYFNTTFINVGS